MLLRGRPRTLRSVKVCSWCAEELADDAIVCSLCGRDPSSKPELARPSRTSDAVSPGHVDPIGSDGTEIPPTPSTPLSSRMNGAAAAAIIIVVLSYAASFAGPLFALLVELIGGGLGLLALRQIQESGGAERGREIALIAVVLAGLGVLGFLLAVARGAALVG